VKSYMHVAHCMHNRLIQYRGLITDPFENIIVH